MEDLTKDDAEDDHLPVKRSKHFTGKEAAAFKAEARNSSTAKASKAKSPAKPPADRKRSAEKAFGTKISEKKASRARKAIIIDDDSDDDFEVRGLLRQHQVAVTSGLTFLWQHGPSVMQHAVLCRFIYNGILRSNARYITQTKAVVVMATCTISNHAAEVQHELVLRHLATRSPCFCQGSSVCRWLMLQWSPIMTVTWSLTWRAMTMFH